MARRLGISVRGGKAKCPFHNDQTPSLSFKDGRFKCFGCDASGDAIDLVVKMRHVGSAEAAQWISETCRLSAVAAPKKRSASVDSAGISSFIGVCVDAFALAPRAQLYMQERGFTGESMLRFRFGYDVKHDAIVIPYGSQTAYYTSRNISAKRFFKPPAKDVGPEPLFYEESLDQNAPVFVVESAFCSLSIMQEGENAVAICGTGNRKLIDAIRARETVPQIIVCMDRDEPGTEAAEKLCIQLKTMGVPHIRLTTPDGYKDPNELLVGDRELFRTWLADSIGQARNLPRADRSNAVETKLPRRHLCIHCNRNSIPDISSTDIGNSHALCGLLLRRSSLDMCRSGSSGISISGKRWEPDIGGLRKRWSYAKNLPNELMVYAVGIIADEQLRERTISIGVKKWQARKNQGNDPERCTGSVSNPYGSV